jgi:hypothetical protein
VEVAGLVLGQQQHVEAVFVQLGVAILHGARGEVGFDADDGLDTGRFGGAVEGHGTVHGAVIGEGDGGLVQFNGALHQVVDAAQAVEQGILAVDMEMDKGLVIGHGLARARARVGSIVVLPRRGEYITSAA